MDDRPTVLISKAKIMEVDNDTDMSNANSYQNFTGILEQVKTLFAVMEKVRLTDLRNIVCQLDTFV